MFQRYSPEDARFRTILHTCETKRIDYKFLCQFAGVERPSSPTRDELAYLESALESSFQ